MCIVWCVLDRSSRHTVCMCICRAWWLVTRMGIITCTCAKEANTQTHTQAHKTHNYCSHTLYYGVWMSVWWLWWHMCMNVVDVTQTYTYIQAYKHAENTKPLHTYHTMVCVSGCLIVYVSVCDDCIGTCACNDSRSLGVDVSRHESQRKLHPTIFNCYTHCRLSYHVALLHLQVSLITLTERLCSHCQQLLWTTTCTAIKNICNTVWICLGEDGMNG